MVALLIIVTILMFLTMDYFVQRAELRRASRTPAVIPAAIKPQPVPVWASSLLGALPRGVFVGSGHSWAQLEPSGSLRLGADMLPLTALGDVHAVELTPAGTEVRRGTPVATLRNGKRSIVLMAPMDGVIEEVNAELASDPSLVRTDPFGRGWFYRLAPQRLAAALKDMFVGEEAVSWLHRELRRLRDFLASVPARQELAGATLQDGGLPVQGIGELLDEETWARLQEAFFTPDAP
jgi:glycine cleavage system H protein